MKESSLSENRRRDWLQEAYSEARKSLEEGGIPVGAVLVDLSKNQIVARGRNRRVQSGDLTAHAEVDCLRNAGCRTDWRNLALVSTLSPCMMCTGTIMLYKIPHVVVGENANFDNALGKRIMREAGVKVTLVEDPHCIAILAKFIAENKDLWYKETIFEDNH